MTFRWISQLGFRGKLLWVVTLGIFGLALTAALTTAWVTSQRTRALMVAQGMQITITLADQSLLALLYRSEENALKPLNTILSFPDVHRAGILDPNGAPLFVLGKQGSQTDLAKILAQPTGPTLLKETANEWFFAAPVFTLDRSTGQDEGEALFLPNLPAKEHLGYAFVQMSKHTLQRTRNDIFLHNLLIAFTFALGILPIMNFAIKRMTRPLYTLSRVMEEAKNEGTHVYAELDGPREITHMASVFNMMMTSLQERDQRLRNHREILKTEVAIRTRELVEAHDAALTASRHKSEFLANMSHELRTPIQSIIGYADLVREDLEIDGRYDSVEDLNRVIQNSERLLAMINNILTMAKAEAGRLELNLEQVNIRNLASEAAGTMQPIMQQNKNRLITEIETTSTNLLIDREKLLQSLLNLLSNAGKFTTNGTITLRAELQPKLLKITVSDTGIGIPPDQQKLIFEEFRQVDGSTTRKFEGTGLGLAITRRFCALMGGEVLLASTPGQGSSFTIQIPLPIVVDTETDPPGEKNPLTDLTTAEQTTKNHLFN
ncbi:MAG: HAMP domain-containing sensor histidine kinase [Desulfuromonadaceae bacterium]|jgi:two-component system, NarL family, sensor histidine kinase BarA